jgi:hypothetical protein
LKKRSRFTTANLLVASLAEICFTHSGFSAKRILAVPVISFGYVKKTSQQECPRPITFFMRLLHLNQKSISLGFCQVRGIRFIEVFSSKRYFFPYA